MRPKSTWEPTSMKMNSRMMNAVVETNAAIADVGRLSRPPSWITGHEKPTGFHPRVLAPRACKDQPSMPATLAVYTTGDRAIAIATDYRAKRADVLSCR